MPFKLWQGLNFSVLSLVFVLVALFPFVGKVCCLLSIISMLGFQVSFHFHWFQAFVWKNLKTECTEDDEYNAEHEDDISSE